MNGEIGIFGQRIEPKRPDCTCEITETTPRGHFVRTFNINKQPCLAHSSATVIEGELA